MYIPSKSLGFRPLTGLSISNGEEFDVWLNVFASFRPLTGLSISNTKRAAVERAKRASCFRPLTGLSISNGKAWEEVTPYKSRRRFRPLTGLSISNVIYRPDILSSI